MARVINYSSRNTDSNNRNQISDSSSAYGEGGTARELEEALEQENLQEQLEEQDEYVKNRESLRLSNYRQRNQQENQVLQQDLSQSEERSPELGDIGKMNQIQNQAQQQEQMQTQGSGPELGPIGEENRRRREEQQTKNNEIEESTEEEAKETENAPGKLIHSTARLGTYEFYKLCWENLIDSFGATYLYLVTHYFGKYGLNSENFSRFMLPVSQGKDRMAVIKGEEKGSLFMHIAFWGIAILLIIVLAIVVFIVFLIVYAILQPVEAIKTIAPVMPDFYIYLIKNLGKLINIWYRIKFKT